MRVKYSGGLSLLIAGSALAGWQGATMIRGPDSTARFCDVSALATDQSGHPVLVWARWLDGIVNAHIELSRWDGSRWDAPARLPDTIHFGGGYNQDIAFDPEGCLFLVYGTQRQNRCDIWSSRRDPATGEWELPEQVNDPDSTLLDEKCCRISIGGGQVWATWGDEDYDRATCNIKAGHWNADTGHWEPEMTVNPDTGGVNRMEWFSDIAVDACGVPHIVWTKATPGQPQVLLYSRYEGNHWKPPLQLTNPDTFSVGGPYGGTRPKLVVDSQNRLYSAFLGARRGGDVVGVYWCRYDPQTGWNGPTRIDTFTSPADPIWDKDIAVAGSDNAWVVYDRGGGNDWRIYAQHFDGVTWSGAERIDDGLTFQGGFPKLALDGYGNPFVAWTADSSRTHEKYAIYYNRYVPAAIAETRGEPIIRDRRLATVTNGGAIFIPPIASGNPRSLTTLLDITGRAVLKLHPGTNDVSRLAPGVYFIPTQSAIRRVLIVR